MVQVFLDTETTGVENGACVVEIAAIVVDDGHEIETFHEYAKPYRKMNPAAAKVTGLNDEFLSQFPEEREVLQRFYEWLVGMEVDEVLAYNAHFDTRIINDRLMIDSIINYKIFDNYKVVDVAKIAKKAIADGKIKKDGTKWNLTFVAGQLGLHFNAHNALEDTRAMYEVYKKLLTL